VFFSPGGALLVTGGRNGLTRVWDAREGVERAVLPTGAGAAVWRDVALSPDARLIVASGSEELTVWDLSTGLRRHTLIDTHEEGHDRVHSFVISPDGALVWAVIADRVHSWSLETGEERGRVDLPDDAIDPALLFDASGRLLGVDRAIRSSEQSVVWDIERGEVAFALPAPRLRLVDPDHPLAVTGGDAGGSMVVHDLNTGTTRASVTIPAAHLPVALSEDGRWIVSMGTRDARGVLITSIADSDTVLSIPDSRMEYAANHQAAAVSAAAGLIAFAEGPGQYPFTFWNARTGEPVREGELDSPYSLRALSEGGRALMVDRMGEGSIVDVRSGEEVVELGRGPFFDALFDESGARLAVIGGGGDATVWDVESGEVVRVVRFGGGGR
jgi:WD40 repeat protein